ncbi:MAG: ATP-dependent sacrificial sulfur transferase LarE [Acidimicrobiia bacterium]|nr:ATP-dependent sacrificial sulfur transferase LarE [Acidimicrobiia bacterium]
MSRVGSDPIGDEVDHAIERLRVELRNLGSVVVAFSGGADSAFLARMAHDELGDRAVAVTAVSPSLAGRERDDCAELAREWSLSWVEVETTELDDEQYVRNDADRCFRCKTALMDVLEPMAADRGAVAVLGVNLDDLDDHRPGQRAAAERGAQFPLVDSAFTKATVREASRRLGLRTWNKPAAACLSSRVPYGTAVTVGVLGRVERAEAALHGLGFTALRVRHYGDVARIEVPVADLASMIDRREQVVVAVRSAGYRYVTVDLEGLRSGNLNDALDR